MFAWVISVFHCSKHKSNGWCRALLLLLLLIYRLSISNFYAPKARKVSFYKTAWSIGLSIGFGNNYNLNGRRLFPFRQNFAQASARMAAYSQLQKKKNNPHKKQQQNTKQNCYKNNSEKHIENVRNFPTYFFVLCCFGFGCDSGGKKFRQQEK